MTGLSLPLSWALVILLSTLVRTSPRFSRTEHVDDHWISSSLPDDTEATVRSTESTKSVEWRPLRTHQNEEPLQGPFRLPLSADHPHRIRHHSKHSKSPTFPGEAKSPQTWSFDLQPPRIKVSQSADTARKPTEANRMFQQFEQSSLWNSGRDDHECPMKNGKKYLSCPSKSRRKFTVCIADEDLCDGRPQCPNREDEDPTSCLFYKTFHKYFTVVMGTLTELSELMASHAEL